MNLYVGKFPKEALMIMYANRNGIPAFLRIIIPVQTNRTTMMDIRIIFPADERIL